MRDNHSGPRFEDVQKMFPQATRFHWHQDAFKESESGWRVGTPIECGGGSGVFWKEVPVSEIQPSL
jgi:hypothetical protein